MARLARLQLKLPSASTQVRVGTPVRVPDSEEGVDIEAFRAEADSLKARYEYIVRLVTFFSYPFVILISFPAETRLLPTG